MIRLPPYKPAESKPIWDLSVPILDEPIRYRLFWWARRGAWTMDLWHDNTLYFSQLRLSVDFPLLRRYRRDPPLPVGRFMLYDLSGAHQPATLDGLGWTHQLYFVEPDDFGAYPTRFVTVT
jgi:hypothetical protein